jgi:anti-sigma factor RsiW
MTMWTRHVSGKLAAYADGELTPRAAQKVELHLGHCMRCRSQQAEIRSGIAMMERLPSIEAPAAIWTAIEANLADRRQTAMPAEHPWRLAFAGAALLAVAAVAIWRVAQPPEAQWEVQQIEGIPAVGGRVVSGAGQVGAGEWIETDAGSRATVAIGVIGSVEVGPNTRVRVVATRPEEHRLALDRGQIRATISAPPRLFFVDTASGTAVDLGCEYALSTDEDGSGMLQVTRGWVSFQWNGLESLVPAGASCPTRPGMGPGLPYFDDATDAMKQALATFVLDKAQRRALDVILAESRVRDTLTLWHLLSRVDVSARARVYDRMAALTPVPPGVSREKALELDPATLTRWREELAWTW